jgi:hypothetical protein
MFCNGRTGFFPFALILSLSGVLPTAIAQSSRDGETCKAILKTQSAGPNLLRADAWRGFDQGFVLESGIFVCDNAGNPEARRGASQTLQLNQKVPSPIIASAWSKAEAVSGGANADYALYLDLVYMDGTPLWGQTSAFAVGTHDWQRREVVVVPEKPVRSVTVHLLLRGHAGKASFRDAELHVPETPSGACVFDGVAVRMEAAAKEGFQIRDVQSGSDFVHIEREAMGIQLQLHKTTQSDVDFWDVELRDTTGKDRAITLVYAVPVTPRGLQWWDTPRQGDPVEIPREYCHAARFSAGCGRLSRYPLAAVTSAEKGLALGVDLDKAAFYRIACNSASGELFIAWDIGLTPEKPAAQLRFCKYSFAPQSGFRAALSRYYELFPEAFRVRIPQQGQWMPFAKISTLKDWQDFGFRFKEGNDETAWDDAHGILTFRYTEPMTWWMTMPKDMPRTMEAALAEAKRQADAKKDTSAQALFTSGYHDESGQIPARLLDTPWCNGAVWSTNAMPGIAGDVTEFKLKWNAALREELYGKNRRGDLDGEYVDSSEGYVTDEMDFRRDHFAAAETPLCFSNETHRVGIFRGLIAYEYVRTMAGDVHAMNKFMMANATPSQLCWLAPYLDVLGTETDWNPQNHWNPMSDSELLYRRAICKGKPYCFLMNSRFEDFSATLVEKYMKRALAYGMFPGFFSHNASEGHYFTRPELFERDRPLFKKYVPLCKLVAEAGWEPITHATSDDQKVYVERFGKQYLTVFNDSDKAKTVSVRLDSRPAAPARELLSGRVVEWTGNSAAFTLAAEDVAVIELSGTR